MSVDLLHQIHLTWNLLWHSRHNNMCGIILLRCHTIVQEVHFFSDTYLTYWKTVQVSFFTFQLDRLWCNQVTGSELSIQFSDSEQSTRWDEKESQVHFVVIWLFRQCAVVNCLFFSINNFTSHVFMSAQLMKKALRYWYQTTTKILPSVQKTEILPALPQGLELHKTPRDSMCSHINTYTTWAYAFFWTHMLVIIITTF